MNPPNPIPLLDLTRLEPDLEEELRSAFARVLRSGRFILGPEVEAFEKECAEYIGVREAVGVSSGTDALLVSLMALDIGAGDEVLSPAFTFFATAGSIWRTGAKPVFCDIRPCCFALDPEDLARKAGPRARAAIPVHLFGQLAPIGEILELARSRNLALIEDAAQAIGAGPKGGQAGTAGDTGCFSFFPTKNLGGLGDGGLVTTQDPSLAAKVRRLRTHGQERKYRHVEVGGNFRLDALQAAFLRLKLKRLDRATEARRRNAALYRRLFEETGLAAPVPSACRGEAASREIENAPIGLPSACRPGHVFNQFVVRVRGGLRDDLRARLTERGIGTEIYYPTPLHLQPCFEPLGGRRGDHPHAEKAAEECLALPIFPELREDEIARVVSEVAAFLRTQKPKE